jgi:thermitase
LLRPTDRLRLLLAALLLVVATDALPIGSSASRPDADVAPGRVVVKPREGRSASALRVDASSYGATAIEERPRLGTQVWRVAPGTEIDVARRLSTRGDIEYAEPDALRHSKLTPNDPYYAAYQWNLPKVNAPQAWDVTTGDPSIKVAVIDSGFDLAHPDGPAHLMLGCDYVRWRAVGFGDNCPSVSDDEEGHGTHVAGIIAARQNNAIGISGLAPNVTLIVIRTADETGDSYASDVASAIREAVDAGARVVNLSLGGPTSSLTEYSAISYAIAKGVVVVAAAGNGGDQGSPVQYPAAFAGVLAVGAASNDDQHSYFSNQNSYVALVAPGGSALDSSDRDVRHWITSLFPLSQGGYQLMEGTSQAAPHVAAVAGLVLSVRPTLAGANVVSLLESTARPLGSPVPNDTFGYGYLDALAAVRAARAVGAAPTPAPTPNPTASSLPTATPSPSATPLSCVGAAGIRGVSAPPPTASASRSYLPIGWRGCGF